MNKPLLFLATGTTRVCDCIYRDIGKQQISRAYWSATQTSRPFVIWHPVNIPKALSEYAN